VHDRGLPYLGVCFGAQVLAAALGGTVERAPRPELGWVSIETVAPDLIASGPWFQWHRDRFTVPPGGTALAHNDVGVQAFRIGQSVGVQFHPEVDTLLLRSWLADDGTPPDPLFFELDVDPRAVLADAASIERTGWRNTHRLIDRFLEEAT
jgi:GMP synthase-like glutamine amidotransferase